MDPMTYVMSPRGILKVSQMVLVVVVVGLWFSLVHSWQHFVTGTVFLSLFTCFGLFAQNALHGHSRVLEILLSGVLSIFFFVSGILVLAKYSSKEPVADACGAFSFFLCVIYGLDVFFSYRQDSE
ncbi:uncharacterized protein [Procambarus clarkii]|uniref:uncharacterized protein n=1 Tax=Procambarus clarkii TaxID=6728 RepID=UPI001E675B53|nr:uncharacterized protein LOC123761606 [Procambarus clarkii]